MFSFSVANYTMSTPVTVSSPAPIAVPATEAIVRALITLSHEGDYLNLGSSTSMSFTVKAGAGDDDIYMGAGHDIVYGSFGEDWIFARNGNDLVDAGSEDDFVSGGNGNDTLLGGSGDDELQGNNGTNRLNGGYGDDELYGSGVADVMQGGAGHDYLRFEGSSARMFGGDGNDAFVILSGIVRVEGGAGYDGINFGAGVVAIGGDGADGYSMWADMGERNGVSHIIGFNPEEGDTFNLFGYTPDQVAIDPRHSDRLILTDATGDRDVLVLRGVEIESVDWLNQQDWFSSDMYEQGGKSKVASADEFALTTDAFHVDISSASADYLFT